MHESSIELIRCLRCGSKLELDVFHQENEINEGLIICNKCNLIFPIIEKIPILWNDFSNFLSHRKLLSGQLYRLTHTSKMKNFVKNTLKNTKFSEDDRSNLEERWSKIYQDNNKSHFYSVIKSNLDSIKGSSFVLEYGCSIGIISSHLCKHDKTGRIFGIDRSFPALQQAKKIFKPNLDYFLTDFLSPIFGKLKFDLIIALNVLELIEPSTFLKKISNQISSGHLILSDPYDFERGKNSVRKVVDEHTLRQNLIKLGFKISSSTSNPSFIKWNLKLNSRTQLNYLVDLIIASKKFSF